MDIDTYQQHAQKLNMLAEIKIFEELKTIHIEDEHSHPFIYLCFKCNQYCEEILGDFVIYQNERNAQEMETKRKEAIDEDIRQQLIKDSQKLDKYGNASECVGVS